MCALSDKLLKTNPNCSGCTVSYGRILQIGKSHNLVKFCRIYSYHIFKWNGVAEVIFATTCTTGGAKIVFACGVNFKTKLHTFTCLTQTFLFHSCVLVLSNCLLFCSFLDKYAQITDISRIYPIMS